jgi:opacity protein-like surface antigen
MKLKNSTSLLILFLSLQLACLANATDSFSDHSQIEESNNSYKIIEVKEGEFSPKDENGKVSNKKYSAYFLSMESEEGEDEDSYKRGNYNYIGVKAGAVMPDNLDGNSNLSGNSTKNTSTFGIVAGRKIMDRFAIELEYAYRAKSTVTVTEAVSAGPRVDSWGASKSNTLMVNISVDIVKGRFLRPYVKAGIGTSSNKSEDYTIVTTNNTGQLVNSKTYVGATNNQFAWQAGAGLNMTVNKTFDVNLEYMYVDLGQIKTASGYTYATQSSSSFINSDGFNGKLVDNVVTIGLKVKF